MTIIFGVYKLFEGKSILLYTSEFEWSHNNFLFHNSVIYLSINIDNRNWPKGDV